MDIGSVYLPSILSTTNSLEGVAESIHVSDLRDLDEDEFQRLQQVPGYRVNQLATTKNFLSLRATNEDVQFVDDEQIADLEVICLSRLLRESTDVMSHLFSLGYVSIVSDPGAGLLVENRPVLKLSVTNVSKLKPASMNLLNNCSLLRIDEIDLDEKLFTLIPEPLAIGREFEQREQAFEFSSNAVD